tara:strand:- start:2681 stop:3145 length:465 start_codon:yes stop_codon:yes gene_type:complete
MKYFLNSIIIFLIFSISLFGWAFLKNFTTTYSDYSVPKAEKERIKLFENQNSDIIRIAVLNGSKENGLAKRVATFLDDNYGLIITKIENADNSNYEKTKVIIIKQKNKKNIENVLTLLGMGIHHSNVEINLSTDFDEDIQIIIGKDYKDFINLN